MFKLLSICLIMVLLSAPCFAEDKKPTDTDNAKAVAAEQVQTQKAQAEKDKKERRAKDFEKVVADLKVKHNCEQVISPPDIVGFIIRGQSGVEQLMKLQIVTVPKD